jgi:glycosyltransferase involved in cell wall biosynthesis
MMQPLKVGLLSAQDCLDRNSWSGILYHMQKALKERGIEIVFLNEFRKNSRWKSILRRIWKDKAAPEIGSPSYITKYKELIIKVQEKLIETPCDIIFAPAASEELAFLETTTPIIYLSDATRALYWKHYGLDPSEQGLAWRNLHESTAMSKSQKIVYSSAWAANSAIVDHGVEPEKIEIIPFGANIDTPPSIDRILIEKQTSICRLLFVGRDWKRKGGEIAVQTLMTLNQMGIDTELTVVGSVPSDDLRNDKLAVIPFINKNIPSQRDHLNNLFLRSNFFLFPTRADCSPIVTCEANAFGLPVITTDVGGIPTIIRNGKNGYMLPLSATGNDYAQMIAKLFSDKATYEELVQTSREEYDQRLNWKQWAESLHNLMLSLL